MVGWKEKVNPANIEISRLREGDIDQLEPILRQHVRNSETGEIIEREVNDIRNYMRGARDEEGSIRTYLVARDTVGKILGCVAYSDPDSDMLRHFNTTPTESSELLNAFVSSEVFRGGGVGRILFERVCEEVRQVGKRQLLVNSGPRYEASWGFYDKICGERCGVIRGKYNGRDAMTWRKLLS